MHEARGDIDVKNELATGAVSASDIAETIKRCNGKNHSMSKHYQIATVDVHVLKKDGWYIKSIFSMSTPGSSAYSSRRSGVKLHYSGEKGRAICGTDGGVSTTFKYRDVPFSDGSGTARQILVGICDICDKVVAIPPQSTPAIRAARKSADVSIEARLPALYLDALDLACFRINPNVTPDFRKRLLMYYVHRSLRTKSATRRLAKVLANSSSAFLKLPQTPSEQRRLSMKVSAAMSRDVNHLLKETNLTKTKLFKSLVVQINEDIVVPEKPENLDTLQTLAMVASC